MSLGESIELTEHAGEKVLSDGACAMGKRQAWGMARPEEMELKMAQPGRVQQQGLGYLTLESRRKPVLPDKVSSLPLSGADPTP